MNPSVTSLPHLDAAPARTAERRGAEFRSTQITVRVVASTEGFAALAPAWNRLHGEAAVASVFTSWIWQFHWWQVYGGEQPLRVLVAFDGDEAIGILPLYLHTVRMLRLPVRLLRLIGTGGDTHPDDLGPVLEPRRAHLAAYELARAALALREADVLLVSDLNAECPLRAALESAGPLAGRAMAAAVCERIALVRLPASWDEYLRSLGSHGRQALRYYRRKLAKGHAVRFFVWDDPARLDEAFERLAELHRRRWQPLGGSHSFSSAEYLEFHRRVMHVCLPRGWLRLYCLEVDGEIAAMTYCYRFRNTVFCMQSGFDPARAKMRVGGVLLGYAFEHAIGEGNRVFDFLRGRHDYKDQVASEHRETHCVRAFRATPGGLAYRLRKLWLPRLKARLLRRPLPPLEP